MHHLMKLDIGLKDLQDFIRVMRVIPKVTLSSPCFWACFHPYPLFQWYLQSKEILLNLSMKCWNSAFNAQGSRVIISVVQVGAVKIYVVVEALKKMKDRMKLSLLPKLHYCGSQLFRFVKFSFRVPRLMPPNRWTLPITLL
jgi:hypothetical protein